MDAMKLAGRRNSTAARINLREALVTLKKWTMEK